MITFYILLAFLNQIGPAKVEHIAINSRPTFSYIIIHLSTEKFDFTQSKKENIINVIIKNAEISNKELKEKEITPKDKIVKKITTKEIEGEGKKYVSISIILTDKKWDWNTTTSGSKIVVFVGKGIPFTEKRNIEEYIEEIVRTKNFNALNFLFSLAETYENKIKALALFGIGELLFQMGIEGKNRILILRSANYYGASGRVFLQNQDIENFARAYFLSSRAFRWAEFYPEAKIAAETYLRKVIEENIENTEILAAARCSLALALVGMLRTGKAEEQINELQKLDVSKIKSDDVKDCYWSAIGTFEYERGHFEKAGEMISHVSDRFILKDPVVLPRFAKTLLKLGNLTLAKKYLFSMANSNIMSLQAEGYLGLFEVLMAEGKPDIAIRYLYRTIENFPGTRWELKARLLAVINRETLKKHYGMLGIKRIPSDDPIFNPIPNLKTIASTLIHNESEIALSELIKIITEKIKEKEIKTDEEIKQNIDFIDGILPSFRVRKIAPEIKDKISENLFELAKTLAENSKGIQATYLFLAHRDFFPPEYLKDYSFLKTYLAELGYPQDVTKIRKDERTEGEKPKKEEIIYEFEKAEDKEKFLKENVKKYPFLAIEYAELLVEQEKCSSALSVLSQWRNEIFFLPEYNYIALKTAYCLFMQKDTKSLITICDMEKTNKAFIEDAKIICGFPASTTYEALIEKIFQEVQKSAGELEELKKSIK